jgi:5'-nucleotidase
MGARVLVTNDDGIDSIGLRTLTAALVGRGYEPIVIAPDSDYSGAGTSLIGQTNTTFSGGREIAYTKRVLEEAPTVEAYALDAPPAMCTLLAMRGAFGEQPSLVASGINFGLNTGPSIKHSGTVSAAITAAGFGVPSLALSARYDFENPDAPLRFDTAAEVGMQLLEVLPNSPHLVLNLNVPQCSIEDLQGIRSAQVAQVAGFYSFVEERTDDVLKIGYKIGDDPMPADADTALVKAGYAAVSSIQGVAGGDCSDIIELLAEAAA